MSIKVYTDGACRGNPVQEVGAFILLMAIKQRSFTLAILLQLTKMEMQAAISALMHLKNTNTSIELYTDSNYLRQGITEWIYNWKKNNWRTSSKKPVANRELWIELDKLNSQMNVNWNWVKGHAGDPGNEKADELANKGADSVS